MRAVLLFTCLLVSSPVEAQLVLHGTDDAPALTASEIEALRNRSNADIDAAEVPLDPTMALLELDVVVGQRDLIDLTGINVLQWSGAILAIAGGVYTVLGLFAALIGSVAGGGTGFAIFAYFGGPGGAAIGVGLGMLAGAEADDDLHRARVLDHRAQRLVPRVTVAANGLTLRF